MRYLSVAALILGACASTVPTPATIYRYEADGLRACQVRLGWTLHELVAACGRPDAMMPWLGHGAEARCLIYRTEAHAFAVSGHAPAIAVCTTTGGFEAPGAIGDANVGTHTVEAVLGMAAMPEGR